MTKRSPDKEARTWAVIQCRRQGMSWKEISWAADVSAHTLQSDYQQARERGKGLMTAFIAPVMRELDRQLFLPETSHAEAVAIGARRHDIAQAASETLREFFGPNTQGIRPDDPALRWSEEG